MNKSRYLIFAIIFIVGMIVINNNNNSNKEKNVEYKTVSHFGVSLDVPQNYRSSYLSTGDQYMFASKNEDFVISIVREDGSEELPLLEVVNIYKKFQENGSVQLAGRTASWSSESISNVEVPIAEVTYLDGVEAGHIVSYFDYKPKDTTVKARKQIYVISKGSDFISIVFVSSKKDYEDYKGIIDHIISTIQVTN